VKINEDPNKVPQDSNLVTKLQHSINYTIGLMTRLLKKCSALGSRSLLASWQAAIGGIVVYLGDIELKVEIASVR
jgi:hypothetical protein